MKIVGVLQDGKGQVAIEGGKEKVANRNQQTNSTENEAEKRAGIWWHSTS